ncbi:ATP-binding protein [Acidipila sp. EB88]|uniref:ATP-binding protein n=1 Tax=Acidipila sp. EB88 TaxID=2305226 RepID=UPI001F44BAA8|nr:ATP-binding protein [Acidipila sp. EB88]
MRVIAKEDGGRVAEPCDCQHQRKMYSLLRRARIPQRYATCTLDNFQRTAETAQAFVRVDGFVNSYPGAADGTGILFTGTVGLGKTHLAVAILQKLTLEKGIPSLFCDYRELLKQITNSYNSKVDVTELEILKPVFETEVLVLDELGAAKPTDWVWDTVALILNTRYNDKRTTIITTNYPNQRAGSLAATGEAPARHAMREETLGDRIGERMWSRLQEMCVPVEMKGPDYRLGAKRARFS